MAAALGAMVSRLAKLDPAVFEADRTFFSAAVERDAEAYQAVVKAYKCKDDTKAEQIEASMRLATTVPLEVLERALQLSARLEQLAVPAKFGSDVATAKALAAAAQCGARANVQINLPFLTDAEFTAQVTVRLRDTESPKTDTASATGSVVSAT
jgi:formiminotetrahydrofolate cyclodeaminase